MRFLKFFIILLFLLVGPKHVFAQTEWTINRYDTQILVRKDGIVDITESIAVDFSDNQKHGIYRDIPYVYSGDNENIYTNVKFNKILRDGESENYEVTRSDSYVRAKIGDANKTISGKHTYVINYTVEGVLRNYGSYDELYWNVTGNNWEVPILETNTILELDGAKVQDALCYQGYTGSTDECNFDIIVDSSVNYTTDITLSPGQGVTVGVKYEPGVIPILTVGKPKTMFDKFMSDQSLTFVGVGFFLSFVTVFIIWYKLGRDSWFGGHLNFGKGESRLKPIGSYETIVEEYEAPDGLRPAEVGLVMDEVAHVRDVTSTIIDLAARGYLNIKEIPKKWAFGSIDYELIKQNKSTKDLYEYESYLYDKLFATGDNVKVSSLKQNFHTELNSVKNKLYKKSVEDKIFPDNPDKVRNKYLVIAIFIIFTSVFLLFFTLGFENIFLVDLFIISISFGILLLAVSRFMSKKTAKGRELYRRTLGYKLFLDTVEKHRQRFFEDKNLLNEVLPYTIVFGMTKKFSEKLKVLDLPISRTVVPWYIGSRPFAIDDFGSKMESFDRSLSNSIASAPKSSGFSSGGGYSGGGFGGGGGGSW